MKRIGDEDIVGCGEEWSERVSALATEAPLDGAERGRIEAHLAFCAPCREHAERLVVTMERVHESAPRENAFVFDPARRAAVIAAATGTAVAPAARFGRWALLAMTAAAAALLAVAGTAFWNRLGTESAARPNPTARHSTLSASDLARLQALGYITGETASPVLSRATTPKMDLAESVRLPDSDDSNRHFARRFAGSNGQVPPTGRTPSDPTPSPTASSTRLGFLTDHSIERLRSMGYVGSPADQRSGVALSVAGVPRQPQSNPTVNPPVTPSAAYHYAVDKESLGLAPSRKPSGSSDFFLGSGDGVEALRDAAAPTPRDAAAERAAIAATAREAVRQYLKGFERLPGERPRDMFHRFFGDNPRVPALDDALSTFAIDVDSASYTLARKSLLAGVLPSRYSVRTEEFVNYFPAETAPPSSGVFAIASDAYSSPFTSAPNSALLRVVVKGREVATPDRKPLALTFVIDVSGSMAQDDRLGLVKRSLALLVGELDERDTVAIVSFGSVTALDLRATPADEKDTILEAIGNLRLRGGTNTCAGLLLGYETAAESFREGAMNRVILCSDGVANEGETSVEKMLEAVREKREMGIYVNTVGVGMGHVNDALLEQFANQGDGVCQYIDDLTEARRVFVTQLTGTLETIAKDVKIQVAFDPNAVATWRQIGYENRAVADEDFRNDAVDGGEVGAGHEVVALYEIETEPGVDGESLGKVSVRWKDPASGAVSETEEKLAGRAAASFDSAPRSFRLHAIVAEFAEILRESVWARGSGLVELGKRLEPIVDAHAQRADVVEVAALVKQAALLTAKSTTDDMERRLIDDLAQNALIRARLADSGKPEHAPLIEQLERQAKEFEEQLADRLVKRMIGDESATLVDVEEFFQGLGYIGRRQALSPEDLRRLEELGYVGERPKGSPEEFAELRRRLIELGYIDAPRTEKPVEVPKTGHERLREMGYIK